MGQGIEIDMALHGSVRFKGTYDKKSQE